MNRHKTFEQLCTDFDIEYQEEERAVNETLCRVFEQVCMNKAYRQKIEAETGYKSMVWYFRSLGDPEELAKEKSKANT